ncbi:hypothetical protein D3C72_1223520 [compost metagenome]
MQQRKPDGGESDEAKQDKSRAGTDIVVNAIGCINHAEQRQCARRRQHARYHGVGIGGGDARHRLAADRFAGKPENKTENGGERKPHGRAEQARFDRIFNEENAAERQRQSTGPDRPARAEQTFEALLRCRGGYGLGGRRRLGLLARQLFRCCHGGGVFGLGCVFSLEGCVFRRGRAWLFRLEIRFYRGFRALRLHCRSRRHARSHQPLEAVHLPFERLDSA